MRRVTESLALSAAVLVAGSLMAACGGTVKSAIPSIAPSRTASVTPTRTASVAPSPTASVAPSPTGAATPTAQPPTHGLTTPALTAQPSSSPAPASGSGTGLIWLWVLLGAVVLAGVIMLIARSGRRRSAAAASWRSRVIEAYAKGSALYDAISVAETPGELVATDAGARWSDIQRRADDLAQTLYALREAAPDDDARARIADVLASLQAVRTGMEAERAPGGAGAQHTAVVRDRLLSFEASLRALRAPDRQAS